MKNLFKISFCWYSKKSLLLALLCFGSMYVFGQNSLITGTVSDAKGQPIPGVSVVVKGTSNGTASDFDGNFTINASPSNILVFSYIGFLKKEVVIDAQRIINVTLEEDVSQLDEVVVVGYGTQSKEEITSSITRVTEEDFNKGFINDPQQLLQGKVAGLNIAKAGGNPNQPFSIRLRGLSTFGANSEPLVIIDGVIGGSLGNIDPNDIKSIDVLKDAAAGAIYGTRGSTGVIIVTTKSGTGVSVPSFEYSGYAAVESISNTINIASPAEFLEFGGIDYGSETDWIDEVSRNALSNVHNFAFTNSTPGGLSYRASINYRDVDGVLENSGFKQTNARINVTQRLLNDKLKLTGIASITNRESIIGFPEALRNALTFNPTAPVFENRSSEELGRSQDLYGGYFETGVQEIFNPVAQITQNSNLAKNYNFLANFSSEWEVLKGLKLGMNYSSQVSNTNSGEFLANDALLSIGTGGEASRTNTANTSELFEFTTTYDGEWNNIKYNLLGGYSFQSFEFEGFSAFNTDFITNGVGFDNLGLGLGITNNQAGLSSFREEANLGAYFGRLNLNFDNNIFLSTSIRREASSRFGANNRWGTFWAVSGGINLASMFEIPKVDQLKFRIGYGVTGNEPGQRYAFLERLGRVGSGFVNGEFVPAIAPVSNPNPELKWEEKAELNIGLDFAFFNSRLSGSFDYFIRNTSDLLNVVPVPSPPNLFGQTLLNLGELETKGFEAQINYSVVANENFQWDFGGNISTFETVLLELNNTESAVQFRGNLGPPGLNFTNVLRVAEGEPIGQIRAAIFAGYNEDGQTEVFDENGNPTTERNLDRDGVIVGNGLPDFTLGINNSFRYKNFDLNFLLRGAFGHSLVNISRAYWEHPQVAARQNIVITENFNPNDLEQDAYHSGYVEKADFLRLDNATLGYNLKMPGENVLKEIRFYVSGNNLFTITKYTGNDPEVRYSDPGIGGNTGFGLGQGDILVPGIDRRTTYFPTRTILLGVNFKI